MTCLIEPFGPIVQAAASGCRAAGRALAAATVAAAVSPIARVTTAGTASVLEKPLLPAIRPPPLGIRHGRVVAARPLWRPARKGRPGPEQSQAPAEDVSRNAGRRVVEPRLTRKLRPVPQAGRRSSAAWLCRRRPP